MEINLVSLKDDIDTYENYVVIVKSEFLYQCCLLFRACDWTITVTEEYVKTHFIKYVIVFIKITINVEKYI